ncbi:hypothetical protein [Anoxynatronum sibiricum]|uniref:Uncharacterized protein n=1 Tax=Anoxynatronum sibiricum TaxID=210623 RepID=A0ABU9VY44_9CLOT
MSACQDEILYDILKNPHLNLEEIAFLTETSEDQLVRMKQRLENEASD